MILHETCTCGASLRVEDDDTDVCAGLVQNWHQDHRCGQRLDIPSAHGIIGGSFEIGFRGTRHMGDDE